MPPFSWRLFSVCSVCHILMEDSDESWAVYSFCKNEGRVARAHVGRRRRRRKNILVRCQIKPPITNYDSRSGSSKIDTQQDIISFILGDENPSHFDVNTSFFLSSSSPFWAYNHNFTIYTYNIVMLSRTDQNCSIQFSIWVISREYQQSASCYLPNVWTFLETKSIL